MKLKLLTTLALLLMAVSGAWALEPLSGDTWDEGTKTLTVNSNPGSYSYKSKTEIEHLIISASVTTIGSSAFNNCTNLTSVTFAAGSQLKSIDSYAFYGSGLTSISIPASVTTIGSSAFYNCTNLTSVTFAAGSLLESIGFSAFYGSGLTSISIPASVTTIESQAFYNCSSLTSVTFAAGSQLESIGYSVFHSSGLTSITIPASVTTIGSSAFYNCTNLTSVTFAAGSQLESIGSYAFYGSGLTSISIPASVTTIESQAFYNCSSLTSVTFAAGSLLKSIGFCAFYGSGLTSITIPASVTTIGSSAFYNCTNLTSVTFAAGSLLESIGNYAFAGCNNASLNIIIPASVTSVGTNAFEDVAKVTGTVTQSNFSNFFDANGELLDNVPFNELIFQGNFAKTDLGVSYITLARPITITGDNAVLNDMAFIIAGSDVTLDKLTLVANSDLGNLIDIAGENAVISNSNITYVVTNYANAINVYSGADGVQILKNTIYFESTVEDYAADDVTNAICVNSGVSIFDDEDPIEGLVIDGNKITAVIPAFLADINENEYYVMGLSAVNGVRINGAEDFKFTNNTLNVTTNWLYRTTPTLQGMYVASSSGLIDKNNISMIDIFTPEGKDVYLYALELVHDEELTISKNNFNLSTTGGKDEAGSANAIIAIGSDFSVVDNNITTVSKGPNVGIYFPANMGYPCDAVISGNLIKVTGLATAAHETGLVSGIEIETGCVEISGNTICTYNIGEYAEGNYIYGISYAQDGVTPDVEITDNTIYTEGKYAISLKSADDAYITENRLSGHELTGDAAVSIASGSGNTVENNLPATVTNASWGSLTWSIDADGNFTISGTGAMDAAAIDTYPWYNYCSLFTSISIGEGITSIGNNAFGGVSGIHSCSNVTEVAIPSTVTSIGADAFKGCVGATDVYCFADPANLTWEDAGDDFKPATDPKDKTKCHVADGSDWSGFSNVNVTFVDDLADVCIPYIDANGTTAYCTDYTEINTSNMPTTLDAGWYVVTEDVTYTSTVTTTGDVTLILADGKTMSVGTATDRIASGNSIFADKDYSLTIYGQTLQTGILNAFNSDKQAVYLKNYIQHGGNVTIDATNDDAIRLYGNDLTLTRGTLNVNTTANEVAISFYNTMTSFVTVTGGNLTATSSYSSIYGNLNMSGGTLTATGYLNGNVTFTGGTATIDGSIWSNATLGWTNASDYITATSYYGTVTIADSKSLSDGTTIYNSGALNDDQKAAIAGKTLQPAVKITLPTGVTATGTGVINQTDETYALSGTTATIAAATGYIISNVNTTGADLTDNGDDTYTFTVGTTDVTVTATVITYIVTQSNFFNYFDDNGCLLDNVNVPFNELIFQGEFSNSNNELVPYIFLDRSITITGDNAVLNDMAFIIAADNVTLDKLTLVANSDLGNLIDIAGENAVISNSNITYVVSEPANAINLHNGSDGVQILKNTIYFESTVEDYAADDVTNAICVNSGISIFDDEDPIEGLVIDGNKITAVIPAFLADIYENEYYVMGLSAVNGVRINGAEDFKFTNNTLDVTTNRLDRTTPTFQAMYVASSSGLIDKNNISMIDIFTPEGKDVYLYALELVHDEELTISKNNFNLSTTGGKDEAGSANAIIAIGSDFSVVDNNITTVSKGPNAGIYFPSMMGAPCEAVISGNTIKVTGLSTAAHNTGLVSGIEISTGCLEITDNTIYTYNIGEYAEGNYIYGISYAWDGTTPDVVITDNTVTTEGQYAISFLKVDDAVITGNILFAHELTGDDAVCIADGSRNTVENNLPVRVTLFADGSTNQWMTWCGTGELMTPEDVKVYTVSGIDNNSITLNDITSTASIGTRTMKVIPAYTPVLLYRATVGSGALEGLFIVAATAPESGYDSATGIVTSSATGCTFYGTTKALGSIPNANYTADQTYVLYGERFLLCKDNAGIGANKCWLVLNSPNGSRQLSIGIGSDDNTTGMEDVRWQTEEGSGAWYSLDGRQLNGQPTKKGLYIYKGKKVVIK